MRVRRALASGVVLCIAIAVTVRLVARSSAAPVRDACFDPVRQPASSWLHPHVMCSCGEGELDAEELAAERREAEERRAEASRLEARLDEAYAEQETLETAASACREEAARCRADVAWRHPLICLDRGLSGERWQEQARRHDAAAAAAERRARALQEEARRLAIRRCCDHVYLNP